ncbi:MAG: aldo/keto reductase [Anaerolineales bacterium]|nr:aldo/keto reductase [Anaerolineales bacterium]
MMKYGHIPGIEKPLSRLVQGTIMCNTNEQEKCNDLLDAVLKHGINTFDTAHGYGNGECERSVGTWINSRGVREQVVILGKGCHHSRDRQRVTPFDISADLHDSLARFKTDYIDLYVLHRDDPGVEVGPIVERLHQHKEEGLIRAYGGSNWSHERVAAANAYAAAHGLTPFAVSSPNFSLAYQAKEPWENCISISGPAGAAARAWYQDSGVALFTWSSLAGGFFSGRFRPDNLDTFETYFDKLCVEVYCFDDNWGRLARTEQLAAEKGVSLARVALAYVLSQPQDIYALIACYNEQEVVDNVQALELALTAEELAFLEG